MAEGDQNYDYGQEGQYEYQDQQNYDYGQEGQYDQQPQEGQYDQQPQEGQYDQPAQEGTTGQEYSEPAQSSDKPMGNVIEIAEEKPTERMQQIIDIYKNVKIIYLISYIESHLRQRPKRKGRIK